MTVCFSDGYEIVDFLKRAGYKLDFDSSENSKHYLIIGGYIKSPIGCTSGDGRLDVLMEEPSATFQEVEKEQCPVCNDDKEI